MPFALWCSIVQVLYWAVEPLDNYFCTDITQSDFAMPKPAKKEISLADYVEQNKMLTRALKKLLKSIEVQNGKKNESAK